MKAQAVVIRITKSAELGKIGKIVAEVESLFLADAMATGLQRMQQRGEMNLDVSFMYCGTDRIHHASLSYGFKLEE